MQQYHLKMVNRQLRPLPLKVFEDQPPVTMIGGGFTTKKSGRQSERGALQLFLNTLIGHECTKSMFVFFPASFPLFEFIQHFLGGSQQRLVYVFCAADFS